MVMNLSFKSVLLKALHYLMDWKTDISHTSSANSKPFSLNIKAIRTT